MNTYIDFHTHTTLSDGAHTQDRLCQLAQAAGIGILAITDHNRTDDLTALRQTYPNLKLVQGAEISCLYTNPAGKETELHVVALGFDPNNPKIQKIFARNQPNRAPYVNAILDKLRLCGIDLGSYEDLCKLIPHRHQIGRMDIAKILTDRGDTASVDQAFDEYLGAHGRRKAFVPNTLRYVSLEDVVDAILDAGGAAILAHLYYYLLSEDENHALLRHFKDLTGDHGGMEVSYRLYDQKQRMYLTTLADQYNLMYSVASDFHGQGKDDSLENCFREENCSELLKFLGIR